MAIDITNTNAAYGEWKWSMDREALLARFNQSVPGFSLALFRILFGLVMSVAMVRTLVKGWVQEMYLAPSFFFTWEWFPWVQPLPGTGMYWLIGLLALLALGIACGMAYRTCSKLFFFGFTYLELIDQTTYLNHYYLVSLLSLWLVFLPADAVWSWDKRNSVSQLVPVWTIWILRFQIGLVFFFAGVAKLNPDWLLDAQPMRIWLGARSDLPLIGTYLLKPWMAYSASWIGALYDLSIPFLLSWSRTRNWACLAVLGFHLATGMLFQIGIFPWLMMSATLVFIPPETIRQTWQKCFPDGGRNGETSLVGKRSDLTPMTFILLLFYAVLQICLPLRSFLYPQQGAWDGRGFNFSWRVMLVEKTGDVRFYALDPHSKRRERLPVSDLITARQKIAMAQDPGMIRQMAIRLHKDLVAAGKSEWEVRVDSWATINGRPSQRLIRPDINLAGELPVDWVVPLKKETVYAHTSY